MTDDHSRRRVLETGGLLATFGVSGCLRLTSGDTQQASGTTTNTDTATATDARTDASTESGDETAADDGVEYPPGISEDGVTTTLVLSHRQAVADTARTVETKYMFERRTARVNADAALVTGERVPDTYIAGGQMYQRATVDGQTVYGYRNDVLREYDREALTGIGVLRALIDAGNFVPAGTQTTDGETNVLLEADAISDQAPLQETDSISRYFRESEFPLQGMSGSGVVTQDGVIRELRAFLEGSGDSGEFLVRTSGIGSTDVPTPNWTSTAESEEAQFEAELVDDGTYIRVEQVAGQSVEAGMEIDAYDGSDYYDSQGTRSTSPGTVFFLYKTDETTEFGSQRLGVSKGSRPSESPAGTWSGDNIGWNLSIGPLRVVDTRNVG